MVKMFYAAGAATTAADRRIGPRWNGRDVSDGRCGGDRGRGIVAVSGYVLLIFFGDRRCHVFGYMALGYADVGRGRAQRIGQSGHSGETHQ